MRKHRITALICLICILFVLALPEVAFGIEFTDVPITASYYKAVDSLSNDGVIQGRGNNTYGPGDFTTRAEFCAFVARANNYNEAYCSTVQMPFNDISGAPWATEYISFCYEKGYVNGMDENTFAPNSNVTCEQAVKMIVCSSGVGDESLSSVGPKWYSGYINVARKNDLLDGADFQAGKNADRAFVAQVVYNSVNKRNSNKGNSVDAIDVSSKNTGKTTADAQPAKVAVVYEPEEIWEPSPEDVEWNYYQYYGEEYKSYMESDKNSLEYTVPEKNTEDDYEYVPRGYSDGMLIVIDPGHNYNTVDTGAVGNGLREQDITFLIADKLKPMLERNGFEVIMTRNSLRSNVSTESVSASLSKRAEIANKNGADLFVSIHCNAGGGTGTETYYCTGSGEGKVFAGFIQNGVLEEVGLRNRGVKSAKYAVLTKTNMTAALVETAFIDTENDAMYLGDEEHQEEFARGIAKGICDFVGIDFN